jgi:hypothetical protein
MATALTRSIEPEKLRPWHEHVIDILIAEPNITQREIAGRLNRSEYWLSIVVNSDAFQQAYKARKAGILDPLLVATVEERLTAVANKAADKLMDRLAMNAAFSNKELIETAKMASTALGLGPSKAAGPVQNLYIIPAPVTPVNSTQWAQMARGEVIENGTPSTGG